MFPVLKMWTEKQPLIILQMLPEWMWRRTALDLGTAVGFKSSMMGVANQQLSLHKPLRRSRSIGFKVEDRSKIPVITLDWDKAAQWSQMLIGKADALVPGYLLPPELEIEEDISSSFLEKEDGTVNDLEAAEIVKRFRMTTSPLGRELAGLLAASPVINLPVVRLIQESLLPKSNQVQVAEVFLGGLLRPQSVSLEKLQSQESESKTILNPDSVEYEFIQPEIRDIFLDDAPISDSIDVVNAVSRYVAEQLGVSLTEFMAVLKAPQQAQEEQREDIIKPFAQITARVLRKLGGQYVQFAEELEQPVDKTISNTSYQKEIEQDQSSLIKEISWTLQQSINCHQDQINCVVFSPDGQLIASASNDGKICLSNLKDNLVTTVDENQNKVWSVAFNADGNLLISGNNNGGIYLWQGNEKNLIRTWETQRTVYSVAFHPNPNSQFIASAGISRNIEIYEINGSLVTILEGHQDIISSVIFSPDGKQLVSCSDDKTIKIWDWETRQLISSLEGHTHWVNAIAFHPNGKFIVSASSDKTVRLWSVEGMLIRTFEGHTGEVSSVAFNHSGEIIASGSRDGTIHLWNLDGDLLSKPLQAHKPYVKTVAFSPDGKILASGGSDNLLKMWNNLSEQKTLILQGSNTTVYSLLTNQPWSLPFDALVISTGQRVNFDGRLAQSFREYIGVDRFNLLEAELEKAISNKSSTLITPDSPLFFELPSPISRFLQGSSDYKKQFLVFATVENPQPKAKNAGVAVEAIVEQARQQNIQKIYIPLLGTGGYQLSIHLVSRAMLLKLQEMSLVLPSHFSEDNIPQEITLFHYKEDGIAIINQGLNTERIAIIVDGDNLLNSLNTRQFNYQRLISYFESKSRICQAYFYLTLNNESDEKLLSQVEKYGYVVKVVETKKIAKNLTDSQIIDDLFKLSEEFDTLALVSDDIKFYYLLQKLKEQGKRIEVMGFNLDTSTRLRETADVYHNLNSTPDLFVENASLVRLAKNLFFDNKSTDNLGLRIMTIENFILPSGWIRSTREISNADYILKINENKEYVICDRLGTPYPYLEPALSIDKADAPRRLVERLVHLAKYHTILALENQNPELNNEVEYELLNSDKKLFADPTNIRLLDGDQCYLRVKNISSHSLNIAILDFEPTWEISKIPIEGDRADFYPLEPGQQTLNKLRLSLPDEVNYLCSYESMKLFLTRGIADFGALVLPSLDVDSGLQSVTRAYGGTRLSRTLQESSPLNKLIQLLSSDRPSTQEINLTDYAQDWSTKLISLTVTRSGNVLDQPLTQEVKSASDAVSESATVEIPSVATIPAKNRSPLPIVDLELPGGSIPLESKFYVEREPWDERCCQEIERKAGLIQIKAPRQMGKTSLLVRIRNHAAEKGFRTINLDFLEMDEATFASSSIFLKRFCVLVSRQLGISPQKVTEFWDEDLFGPKENCSDYIEQYLLADLSSPLVLNIDELDRFFSYDQVAKEFLMLLRTWNEKGRVNETWSKLRIVITYSTESYVVMETNSSPFNVGLAVDLAEFTSSQVLDLAVRHGLNWQIQEVEQLMVMVGGHPYLVRLSLYHIAKGDLSLAELLAEAPTDTGLFAEHLRRHLWNLQQHPELAEAFHQVIFSDRAVILKPILAFKLNGMGLVNLKGNEVIPRYDRLYRPYFRSHLSLSPS
jgi:serine/threonine-protein kinase